MSDAAAGDAKAMSPKLQTVVQQHKEIQRKILDLAARDPAFRSELVDNPRQALEGAGLAQEVEQFLAAKQEVDIADDYGCYKDPTWYTYPSGT